MGKDRYHYDAKGKFKGRSSDDPPMSGCMSIILIIAIVILLGISGLNRDKKSKETSELVSEEQSLSDTDTNSESEEHTVSESATTNEPQNISEVSPSTISDEGTKPEQQSGQEVIFLPRKEVSQQIPDNPERKYPPCTDSVRDGCQGE
jgi:hypothetical protein